MRLKALMLWSVTSRAAALVARGPLRTTSRALRSTPALRMAAETLEGIRNVAIVAHVDHGAARRANKSKTRRLRRGRWRRAARWDRAVGRSRIESAATRAGRPPRRVASDRPNVKRSRVVAATPRE